MQTEMSKTSERISMMESRFERHSRTFAPSHAPDDEISILAYSDGELLDYSEDDVSLTTEPRDQAIQPTHESIKPPYKATRLPHKATRQSHKGIAAQTPEETQPDAQASNTSASGSSLYDPDSTKSSWEPKKELSTFLDKQF